MKGPEGRPMRVLLLSRYSRMGTYRGIYASILKVEGGTCAA
jgi:hypothetical protein